jgi:hypothetical protein
METPVFSESTVEVRGRTKIISQKRSFLILIPVFCISLGTMATA